MIKIYLVVYPFGLVQVTVLVKALGIRWSIIRFVPGVSSSASPLVSLLSPCWLCGLRVASTEWHR